MTSCIIKELRELRTSYPALTPRKRQVMGLPVAGGLNKQVGGHLGISLHAMQEHQVTAAGKTYSLPDPFLCWQPRTRSSRRGSLPPVMVVPLGPVIVTTPESRAERSLINARCFVSPTGMVTGKPKM